MHRWKATSVLVVTLMAYDSGAEVLDQPRGASPRFEEIMDSIGPQPDASALRLMFFGPQPDASALRLMFLDPNRTLARCG